MNNKQLFQSYLEMPEAQLLGLIELDFDKLLKVQLGVVNDWINNKRCECSKNIHIQNGEMSLKCKHIQERKEERTKKITKKIRFKSDVLRLRRLGEFQRIRKSLHAI